jgi:hypothetical protein
MRQARAEETKKRVFSLLNKVFGLGKKPILIRGVPGAPEGRRAVLSAAGTAKECVRVAGHFRFEHIEISGSSGRGLDIAIASSITLGPGSLVRDNQGGGVMVNSPKAAVKNFVKPGLLILDGGIVENNQTDELGVGGGIYVMGGFTMKEGSVRNNRARLNAEGYSFGGGIYIDGDTPVFIEGGAISGNTAEFGGAIAIRSGSVTMSGGSIFGNTTGIGPDVVVVAGGGVFTQRGGTVRDSKEPREEWGPVCENDVPRCLLSAPSPLPPRKRPAALGKNIRSSGATGPGRDIDGRVVYSKNR